MTNEFGSMGEGLDIGGSPRQDINKATEEAVRRIQEESKKSQQAHQQAQQDRKSNTKLANFLSFLMNNVKDDKLISILYELFFKTKNPTTGVTYTRKKINTMAIVGFFYPFYIKEARSEGINELFDDIINKEPMNLTGYINYIKRLSAKYHDNIALDANLIIKFLINMISYYKLYDVKSLDNEQFQKFVLQVKNELYK